MMSSKRGRELQEQLGREAVSLLAAPGVPADTKKYEEAISLTGKVWKIPEEETQAQLDAISEARGRAGRGELEDLTADTTGTETLDAIWDLFETAVHLDDEGERTTLLELARELEEAHSLLDWIERTPKEMELG